MKRFLDNNKMVFFMLCHQIFSRKNDKEKEGGAPSCFHSVFCFLIVFLSVIYFPTSQAVNIGNNTFILESDKDFVSKRIVNDTQRNNMYFISIVELDRPGTKEQRTKPADGQILFSPKKKVLPAGADDYFRFYYAGPKDGKERYYRVDFLEIPLMTLVEKNSGKNLSLTPQITLSGILVVQPRQLNFQYDFDSRSGLIRNTGNAYFKVVLTEGCDGKEKEFAYVRPGESYRSEELKDSKKNKKFIIFAEKYKKIGNACFNQKK